MKKISVLLFCFALLTQSFAQSPLHWEISSKKTGDQRFLLQIKGTISAGWHVYALRDEKLGLEPLTINWDNETILPGNQVTEPEPITMTDKVFNKAVKVFTNAFSFSQEIKINGQVPASFKITLQGFVSNNEEFLPIEETKEVKLEGGIAQTHTIKLNTVNLQQPAAPFGDEQSLAGEKDYFYANQYSSLNLNACNTIFLLMPENDL